MRPLRIASACDAAGKEGSGNACAQGPGVAGVQGSGVAGAPDMAKAQDRGFEAQEALADARDGGDDAFPSRPNVPPLLLFALSLWLSTGCTLQLASSEYLSADAFSLSAACLCSLCVLALLIRSRRVFPWMPLLGVFIGAFLALSSLALQEMQLETLQGDSGPWHFEAVSDAQSGMYASSCLAKVKIPSGGSAVVSLRLSKGAEVRYGDCFAANASFSKPSGSAKSYCLREGAIAQARIYSVVEEEPHPVRGLALGVRNRAIEIFSDRQTQESALIAALACGWRESLDDETYGCFKVSGLAHLVAVSGAHLSFVVAFFSLLLRALKAPHALSSVLLLVLLLFYLLFTGAPVSAIRAAVMVFAALFAPFAKRRPDSCSSLMFCIVLFLCVDPSLSLSVSFALSALSTFGIVLLSPLISAWLKILFGTHVRFVREALALTLSSNVLSLPLCAALFSQISLISPLSNCLAAPLFAPLCVGSLMAAMFCVLAVPFSEIFLSLIEAGGRLFLCMVHAVASIPHAAAPASLPIPCALLLSACLVGALWLFWPRLSRASMIAMLLVGALLCGVAAIFLPRLFPLSLVMLDVGQGDAILLVDGKKRLLVDTGPSDAALLECLGACGIGSLDALLITHHDEDHCGAVAGLSSAVEVNEVILAEDALSCSCESCAQMRHNLELLVGEEAIEPLGQGDQLQMGRFSLTCVWPQLYRDEGGNADSLCLLVEADCNQDGQAEWSVLLAGDAESEQLQQMIDEGFLPAVDILKVGHHGSKKALSAEVLQCLDPQVALISVGAQNRYGHPADETLEALQVQDCRILRSDEQGTILLGFTDDHIGVQFLHNGAWSQQ